MAQDLSNNPPPPFTTINRRTLLIYLWTRCYCCLPHLRRTKYTSLAYCSPVYLLSLPLHNFQTNQTSSVYCLPTYLLSHYSLMSYQPYPNDNVAYSYAYTDNPATVPRPLTTISPNNQLNLACCLPTYLVFLLTYLPFHSCCSSLSKRTSSPSVDLLSLLSSSHNLYYSV